MAARKLNVGDAVDLGEHGQGQVWGQAPGAGTWHVVDENQQAHVYDERTGRSTPSRSAEFELNNHLGRVKTAYAGVSGSYMSGPTASTRRWNLTDTEAKAMTRSANTRVKRAARKAG